MNDNSEQWIAELQSTVQKYPISFLPLGAAFTPIVSKVLSVGWRENKVSDYLELSETAPEGVTVLTEIESLASGQGPHSLGQLRNRVMDDMQCGSKFVLLSRVPRYTFRDSIGSPLLEDAKLIKPPIAPDQQFKELPACSIQDKTINAVLEEVLHELGPELCATLDRVLYEDNLKELDALEGFGSREREALHVAGLLRVADGSHYWTLPWHLQEIKSALDSTLSGMMDPQPQLQDVIRGLWKIERVLRRDIRRRAINKHGKSWRVALLSQELATKVLERASSSVYLHANSVKQIRDPLEWLTLGELLSLRERPEIGHLGLTAPQWKQFDAQLMPVRNRIAHMRTLRREDASIVAKWRNIIDAKLS